jgi:hypothetical protein
MDNNLIFSNGISIIFSHSFAAKIPYRLPRLNDTGLERRRDEINMGIQFLLIPKQVEGVYTIGSNLLSHDC